MFAKWWQRSSSIVSGENNSEDKLRECACGSGTITLSLTYAKPSADMTVPMSTAFAKSSLTVTKVTKPMTIASSVGIFPTKRREPNEKVDWHTNSMIPANATTGICPRSGAKLF